MFSKRFVAALVFLGVSGVSGFATGPSKPQSASRTALNMSVEDGAKRTASAFLAAAFLASNIALMEPAFAVDDSAMDFGSTELVSKGGRSGGRAGGRSAAARPSSSARSSSSSSRVIERTTVIQSSPRMYQSPVIVAPTVPVYSAPLYNPLPGIGVSMGINAIGNIGRDMQDYRQESEIQRTQAELNASRQREMEMEARLRQLETQSQANQMNQNQQQLMMQQQMMMQQAAAQK